MSSGDIVNTIKNIGRNWLINPDMLISERGNFTTPTSFTWGAYCVDRWRRFGSLEHTLTHKMADQPDASIVSRSLRLEIPTALNASQYAHFDQPIESYWKFQGKTITIGCWVKSNSSSALIQVHYGYGAVLSEPHSGNGQWEYLTATGDVPADSTAAVFYVLLPPLPEGNPAGRYIEMALPKVEIGVKPTNFESPIFEEELLRCQRYYWKYDARAVTGNGMTYSSPTNIVAMRIFTPVAMRLLPACIMIGAFRCYNKVGGTQTVTAVSMTYGADGTLLVTFTCGTSNLGGPGPAVIYGSGTNCTLAFDAEINT